MTIVIEDSESGSITEITSTGNTLDVSDPTGPTVDLEIPSGTYAPGYGLAPSGDTTGSTDSTNISNALASNGHVILQTGAWYIGACGLTVSNRWLQGSGQDTIINVVSGGQGFQVTGATQLQLSDMQFVVGSGAWGIKVAGASDLNAYNLELTGSTASGGIQVQGDSALEQHYHDIVMRTMGGKAFDYERTTTTYTGSLYLDRVRIVTPPSGAYGFYFNSTASGPSLNTAFLTECVSDGAVNHALYINNCGQIFIEGANWFACASNAAAGSAPIRITGGAYGINISGGYLYQGLASGYDILVDGSAYQITVGGGVTFDGVNTATALGISGAKPGQVALGTYQFAYTSDGIYQLVDVPQYLAQLYPYPLSDSGGTGEETHDRRTINSNVTLTSGTLFLSYFRAKRTASIAHIETAVNTAASGGTYAGMGIFTVSSTGLLTLVAKGEQTSSPTLWSSAYEYIGGNNAINTRIALSSNYEIIAGQMYAVGLLFVGSGAPLIPGSLLTGGAGGLGFLSGAPLDPLSAQLSGQSTLGSVGTTTHTNASLSSCGWQLYAVLETS